MVSGVGVSRLATRQLLLRAQNERETLAISVDHHNNENDSLVEGMGYLNEEEEEEEKKDIYEESTLSTTKRGKTLLSLSTSSSSSLLFSVTTTAADGEDVQESKINNNDNNDKSILSSQSHAIQLLSSTSKHSSNVSDITSHSLVPNTELLGVQGSSFNNDSISLTMNPSFHSSNTSIDQIIQLNFQREKSLTYHKSSSHANNKEQEKFTFFPVFVFNGDGTSSPTPSLLGSGEVHEKEVLFHCKEDNTFIMDRRKRQNIAIGISTIEVDKTPWKGGMIKLNEKIKNIPSYKVLSEEGIFPFKTLLGKCLSGSLSSEYVRPRLLSPNKVFLNNSYLKEMKSVN